MVLIGQGIPGEATGQGITQEGFESRHPSGGTFEEIPGIPSVKDCDSQKGEEEKDVARGGYTARIAPRRRWPMWGNPHIYTSSAPYIIDTLHNGLRFYL